MPLWMIGAFVVLFFVAGLLFAIVMQMNDEQQKEDAPQPPQPQLMMHETKMFLDPDTEMWNEIERHLRHGRRLEAVKHYRDCKECNIHAANDAVARFEKRLS